MAERIEAAGRDGYTFTSRARRRVAGCPVVAAVRRAALAARMPPKWRSRRGRHTGFDVPSRQRGGPVGGGWL